MIIIYLTKIIYFFYQYHTIQSQNGQEKRKIRAKKIVYNVKKITKENRLYVKNTQKQNEKTVEIRER